MKNYIIRKRFGQHFLKDKNIIKLIIAAINPKLNQSIVEIGPGLGALTKPLLKYVDVITVIEIDRNLVYYLAEIFFLKIN